MSERMRIRIKNTGPEWWKLRVEDAETGKLLPVTDVTFKAGEGLNANMMVAEIVLVIDEIDIYTEAERGEIRQTLEAAGYLVPEPLP